MSIKILVIDAYDAHRQVVVEFFQDYRPDAVIEEYDIAGQGLPDKTFDWSGYTLVVMDTGLGDLNGLQLLKEHAKNSGMPPIVCLSSNNSIDVAVMAMKLGAADFVLKKGIKPSRLKMTFGAHLPPVPEPPTEDIPAGAEETAPRTDIMPDLKPLPDHYQTQQYNVASTQILPEAASAQVKLIQAAAEAFDDDEDKDDDWMEQTQILSVTPKVK